MAKFDELATRYDGWFMQNPHVLESEARLVARALGQPGQTLSVGCGSGLFEKILGEEFGITIKSGIEPSADMAEIAALRGMDVQIGTAEDADFGGNQWDTILFNGTPSYIDNLEAAFSKSFQALKPGGRIVVLDVPKESSYGLVYNLALTLGTWDHPLLEGVKPPVPYPIEFVKMANWRTTREKVELLEKTGFDQLEYFQTLTTHPVHSNGETEEPSEGCTRGDYVAVIAVKGARS